MWGLNGNGPHLAPMFECLGHQGAELFGKDEEVWPWERCVSVGWAFRGCRSPLQALPCPSPFFLYLLPWIRMYSSQLLLQVCHHAFQHDDELTLRS